MDLKINLIKLKHYERKMIANQDNQELTDEFMADWPEDAKVAQRTGDVAEKFTYSLL